MVGIESKTVDSVETPLKTVKSRNKLARKPLDEIVENHDEVCVDSVILKSPTSGEHSSSLDCSDPVSGSNNNKSKSSFHTHHSTPQNISSTGEDDSISIYSGGDNRCSTVRVLHSGYSSRKDDESDVLLRRAGETPNLSVIETRSLSTDKRGRGDKIKKIVGNTSSGILRSRKVSVATEKRRLATSISNELSLNDELDSDDDQPDATRRVVDSFESKGTCMTPAPRSTAAVHRHHSSSRRSLLLPSSPPGPKNSNFKVATKLKYNGEDDEYTKETIKPTATASTWCSVFMLLAVFIGLTSVFLGFHCSNNLKTCQAVIFSRLPQTSAWLTNKFEDSSYLRKRWNFHLRTLRALHPTQPDVTFSLINSSVISAIESGAGGRGGPIIIIFAYNSAGDVHTTTSKNQLTIENPAAGREAENFAMNVCKALNGVDNPSHVIDSTSVADKADFMRKISVAIEPHLAPPFHSLSEITSSCVLIRELQDLDAIPATVLHRYCDHSDAVSKRSAILFTLNLSESLHIVDNNKEQPLTVIVEEFLTDRWGSTLENDRLGPILSRINDLVILVE